MTPTHKARAMKALLEAAAAIAEDLSHALTDAAETRGAPTEINQMMGAALGVEADIQQLGDILTALKAIHAARVPA